MKVGTTALVQPVSSSALDGSSGRDGSTKRAGRGMKGPYTDTLSGDEFEDSGSDVEPAFHADGTPSARGLKRLALGASGRDTPRGGKGPEEDAPALGPARSYLGLPPPGNMVFARPVARTAHRYQ